MLLRTLIPTAIAAVLMAAPAQAAQVSTTYTTVGESVFVVPPGVHDIDVALTGPRGGRTRHAAGGRGAVVQGRLPVSPGDRFYVNVGGAGKDFASGNSSTFNPGGANGGGGGYSGGGGASDVRTAPAGLAGSLSTRLAVAAGGGGAGEGLTPGGDAGAAGTAGHGGVAGGLGGTLTAGGAGGTASPGGENGTAGVLGRGGDGMAPNFRGGGGGGGLFGGGGGAGEPGCNPCGFVGGGGGGSSLVPNGGTLGLAAVDAAAQVTIAYERAHAAVSATALDFPSTQPGALSGSRRIEVTNRATSTDLIVSGESLDSDEFIVGASNCHGAVAPGAKCTIAVRFAPSAEGSHAGTVTVATNAGPLTIALSGASIAPATPAVAAATVAPATQPPSVASARVTCRQKRCSVAFAGDAPKLTGTARVRATLTRGGRVYASADRVARRGTLRLVLNAKRTVKPGAYTLKLQIGAKRTTRTAIAT